MDAQDTHPTRKDFQIQKRSHIWQKLATDWKPPQLEMIATTVDLWGLSTQLDRILQGQSIGRVVVALNDI